MLRTVSEGRRQPPFGESLSIRWEKGLERVRQDAGSPVG